ncbi:VOC family protein [Sporosarcina sp.]|uniref:VOC family protein n=1 Tax=Sporosarcina sp. TaxID=49982 RepID=UPI002614B590|nr:VOC family protein [Sporosarcina sp.]
MKLDHIVYFTNEKLEEVIKAQLAEGYDAIMGGRHEHWGTANALLYTENAYIEWLTVENLDKAKQAASSQPLIEQLLHDQSYGNGWATVCFSVENMEEWKDELDNKGFQTTDVLSASRRTNDGKLLRWKMLFVEQQITSDLPYPFFIEWEETEAQRFKRLQEQGAYTAVHRNHKITECVFHVDDPLRDTAEWAILLSQKVGDHNDIQIEDTLFQFVEKPGEPERLAAVRLANNG